MDRDNAMDVLGSDQRMRYGLVVDVAKDGLFVDLRCAHRRREYAPFGRIFFKRRMDDDDLCRFRAQQQSVVQVEILVLETASGPWIWQNGEMSLLPRTLYGRAVVHWQSPDTGMPCTDFVSVERVRPRLDVSTERNLRRRAAFGDPLLGDCVRPGDFMMGSAQLSRKVRSLSAEKIEVLIKRVKDRQLRSQRAFVVDVEDGKLQYIYRNNHNGNSIKQVLLRTVKDYHTDKPEEDPNVDHSALVALPSIVWQEIFSHLDTVHQTKLRAVCARWNRILDTPALHSTIAIHNGVRHFLNLSCVYQCFRPSTQRLAISFDIALWWVTNDALSVSELLQYLAARQPAIRLRTIHLHGVLVYSAISCRSDEPLGAECALHPSPFASTHDADFSYGWLQDFHDVCRRFPCDVVLITNGVFHLVASFDAGLTCQTRIRIRSARLVRRGDDFANPLWDALEAALPEPCVANLHELLQQLKMGGYPNEKVLRKLFCTTLCGVQSADPRPTAHYRDKKWCVDGLEGLRLDKLSRLTRHFLVEVLKRSA